MTIEKMLSNLQAMASHSTPTVKTTKNIKIETK